MTDAETVGDAMLNRTRGDALAIDASARQSDLGDASLPPAAVSTIFRQMHRLAHGSASSAIAAISRHCQRNTLKSTRTAEIR
jgi:hypothetical protein